MRKYVVHFESCSVFVPGLGRTGVLLACYLVYSCRVRGNDAIRYVRHKRPNAVQTRGQILCVQQFEQFVLPQCVVFCNKSLFLIWFFAIDTIK
jgi:hypothetical protein